MDVVLHPSLPRQLAYALKDTFTRHAAEVLVRIVHRYGCSESVRCALSGDSKTDLSITAASLPVISWE